MKLIFPFIFSATLISGCAVSKPIPQAKQTFTFDYTPTESSKSGSAGMLIGFVRPYYADNFGTASGELFINFQDALGNDIEELMVAKGFSLKGPYQSFDEMIFEDKKHVETLVQIQIDPRFTAHEGSWKAHPSILGPAFTSYTYKGKVSIVGKINLSGVEPLTNEKIWSKSVLIPNIEHIPIETSGKYKRMLNDLELINDPSVYNMLGKALMKQYAGIMEKIAAHFNVEEFKTLKGQIRELKSKKGF